MDTKTAIINDCAPPLTAKLAPWMREFIAQNEGSSDFYNKFDLPAHLIYADEFKRNVKDLQAPIRERNLKGGLYFARKANKLPWLVELARQEDLGIDTASLGEVKETLALGVAASKIVITAIGKQEEIVDLAISKGCLLIIDNEDELKLIQAQAEKLGRKARVGLRFSGFQTADRIVFSRFGLPVEDFKQIFALLDKNLVEVENLHAHIDRYDTDERACAAFQLLKIIDWARGEGFNIKSIDLGGGILMRYLDSQSQWQDFQDALLDSVKGERPYFTWLNDGLGYNRFGNEIVGKPDLYPAWNNLSKERFVSAVLDCVNDSEVLHKAFSDRNVELYFEPGRCLMDNVGMTLARVTYRKRDTLGNLLLGVNVNRMNVRPFRAEFICDPVFMHQNQESSKAARTDEGAYIVGNLCSESDLLYRRKISLGIMPEPKDVVCFPNTGGYLMHHMEIGTHGDSLPVNILLDKNLREVERI